MGIFQSPKISVIIPIYNCEDYLVACVNSVLQQSFNDFEIVLINDGSTDGSGEICESFAKLDNRIKVTHISNHGLSYARNIGIDLSSGEYVTFIDSDDIIFPDYLKILFSLVEKHEADISSCELLICDENRNPRLNKKKYLYGVVSGKEMTINILRGKIHGTSACGLLIRKNIASIFKFPVGKYHEDDLTTYKYFFNANKVAYTLTPLYVYFQRKGSLMHNHFCQIDIDELDAGDILYENLKNSGDKFEQAAFEKRTQNYLQIYFKYNDLKYIDIETFKRINNYLKINLKRIICNKGFPLITKIKLMIKI